MVRFDAICLCGFLVAEHACCNNDNEGNSDTADKRRPRRTGEAGNQISKQADDGNQGSVGQLGCHVTQVVTFRTSRRKDGGVGNGRDVVTIYCAGKRCADGDQEQRVAFGEYAQNDGQDQGSGAP